MKNFEEPTSFEEATRSLSVDVVNMNEQQTMDVAPVDNEVDAAGADASLADAPSAEGMAETWAALDEEGNAFTEQLMNDLVEFNHNVRMPARTAITPAAVWKKCIHFTDWTHVTLTLYATMLEVRLVYQGVDEGTRVIGGSDFEGLLTSSLDFCTGSTDGSIFPIWAMAEKFGTAGIIYLMLLANGTFSVKLLQDKALPDIPAYMTPFGGVDEYGIVATASAVSAVTSAVVNPAFPLGELKWQVSKTDGFLMFLDDRDVVGAVCKENREQLVEMVHEFLLSGKDVDANFNWSTKVMVGATEVELSITASDAVEITVGEEPPFCTRIHPGLFAAIEVLYVLTHR